MPMGSDRPLNHLEIAQVLNGIANAPPTIPSSVTSSAMDATVNGLELWCDLDQVERGKAYVHKQPSFLRFLS